MMIGSLGYECFQKKAEADKVQAFAEPKSFNECVERGIEALRKRNIGDTRNLIHPVSLMIKRTDNAFLAWMETAVLSASVAKRNLYAQFKLGFSFDEILSMWIESLQEKKLTFSMFSDEGCFLIRMLTMESNMIETINRKKRIPWKTVFLMFPGMFKWMHLHASSICDVNARGGYKNSFFAEIDHFDLKSELSSFVPRGMYGNMALSTGQVTKRQLYWDNGIDSFRTALASELAGEKSRLSFAGLMETYQRVWNGCLSKASVVVANHLLAGNHENVNEVLNMAMTTNAVFIIEALTITCGYEDLAVSFDAFMKGIAKNWNPIQDASVMTFFHRYKPGTNPLFVETIASFPHIDIMIPGNKFKVIHLDRSPIDFPPLRDSIWSLNQLERHYNSGETLTKPWAPACPTPIIRDIVRKDNFLLDNDESVYTGMVLRIGSDAYAACMFGTVIRVVKLVETINRDGIKREEKNLIAIRARLNLVKNDTSFKKKDLKKLEARIEELTQRHWMETMMFNESLAAAKADVMGKTGAAINSTMKPDSTDFPFDADQTFIPQTLVKEFFVGKNFNCTVNDPDEWEDQAVIIRAYWTIFHWLRSIFDANGSPRPEVDVGGAKRILGQHIEVELPNGGVLIPRVQRAAQPAAAAAAAEPEGQKQKRLKQQRGGG